MADAAITHRRDFLWELWGIIIGFAACAFIVVQVYAEATRGGPSSLSLGYTGGYFLIFVFWTCYGIRFRRMALWLTNGLAMILQIGLIIVSFLR